MKGKAKRKVSPKSQSNATTTKSTGCDGCEQSRLAVLATVPTPTASCEYDSGAMQHNFHVGVGPLGLAANEELTRIYAELWTWPPGTTPAVPAQDMTGDETSGYETTFLAPGPGDYFPKVYADWVIHTPDSDIENGPVKTCPNPP